MTLRKILTGFLTEDRKWIFAVAAALFGYTLWNSGEVTVSSVTMAALSTVLFFVFCIGGLFLFVWGIRRIGLLFGAPLGDLGSSQSLKSFIAAQRRKLSRLGKNRPSARGRTQFLLGLALGELGTRETDTDAMRRSVDAFRDALPALRAAGKNAKWALTQRNLAVSLNHLSRREVGKDLLLEAVDALRSASEALEQAGNKADWGEEQSILCAVLTRLGQMEDGTARLDEAVAAGRASLTAEDNSDVPLQDAKLAINLTEALTQLGDRETGTERLDEAVALARKSLAVVAANDQDLLEDDESVEWSAHLESNLGAALRRLGERIADAEILQEAIETLQRATSLRTDKNGYEWALNQNELACALRSLGEYVARPELPADSLLASDSALGVLTRETFPFDWAVATAERAVTLATLVEQTPDPAALRHAASDLSAALSIFEQGDASLQIRRCRANRDRVQAILDDLDHKAARLHGAGKSPPGPPGPRKPRPG